MSTKALDLYAKVEDLLGVDEVAPKLYKEYFEILKEVEFDTLLDIGCGKGKFLALLDSVGITSYTLGIDRSSLMVQKAKERGVNAKVLELKDIDRKFDIATATFDMINYLPFEEFDRFFEDLAKVIHPQGYFLFDINSLYGLSELAVGNFVTQDENRFLSIESFFEEGLYESFFTLFEKKENNCHTKDQAQINQYYYPLEKFKTIKNWQFIKSKDIALYEEEVDKHIVLLQNTLF